MSAEQVVFNENAFFRESLVVSPNERIVAHNINGKPFQRIAITTDDRNVDILEYSRFLNGLWVALLIRPCFPCSDLNDFILGRFDESMIHGMRFTRGSINPTYEIFEKGIWKRTVEKDIVIDWNRLSQRNKTNIDRSNIVNTYKYNSGTKRISFACKLIPNALAPIAQVSSNTDYKGVNSISVDTNFILDDKTREATLEGAKSLLSMDRRPVEDAKSFCGFIENAFSGYFPERGLL